MKNSKAFNKQLRQIVPNTYEWKFKCEMLAHQYNICKWKVIELVESRAKKVVNNITYKLLVNKLVKKSCKRYNISIDKDRRTWGVQDVEAPNMVHEISIFSY